MAAELKGSASRVMDLARREAQRLHSREIGAQHILLAILQEGQTVAARVLQGMSIDFKRVRIEIESHTTPRTSRTVPLSRLPLSADAKRVIELGSDAARGFGQELVGAEYLLFGILQEGQSVAAEAIISLGIRLADVHNKLLEELGFAFQFRAPEDDALAAVIAVARKNAALTSRGTVGTQHLLLAVLEGSSTGAKILTARIDPAKFRGQVEQLLPREASDGWLALSPNSRSVLHFADAVAQAFGSDRTTLDHLILAILFEGKGVAVHALKNLGVDTKKLFTDVWDAIANSKTGHE